MSKCISRHGEYSEHEPDADYVCALCGVLDEDALIDELRAVRAERDALRVGAQEIHDELFRPAGHRTTIGRRVVAEALRRLLDRTSITGE